MSAVPAVAARGLVRPRRQPAPDLAARGLPRRPLGHRRLHRARRLARRRRDDDRARGRRPDRADHRSTPREPEFTMTSYIASIAKGDLATGQRPVQDHLRGRDAAVPDHADPERLLDPLRAQVPAGVRVSAVGSTVAGKRSGTQPLPRDRASRCLLLSCLGLSALMLTVLLVDVAVDGTSSISPDFFTKFSSSFPPERRHPLGAAGHALADGRGDRCSSCPWAWPPPSTSRSTPTGRAGATARSR